MARRGGPRAPPRTQRLHKAQGRPATGHSNSGPPGERRLRFRNRFYSDAARITPVEIPETDEDLSKITGSLEPLEAQTSAAAEALDALRKDISHGSRPDFLRAVSAFAFATDASARVQALQTAVGSFEASLDYRRAQILRRANEARYHKHLVDAEIESLAAVEPVTIDDIVQDAAPLDGAPEREFTRDMSQRLARCLNQPEDSKDPDTAAALHRLALEMYRRLELRAKERKLESDKNRLRAEVRAKRDRIAAHASDARALVDSMHALAQKIDNDRIKQNT